MRHDPARSKFRIAKKADLDREPTLFHTRAMKVPAFPGLFLILAAVAVAEEPDEAAKYHADFQSANEGIVIAKIADGKTSYDSAGMMAEGGKPVGPDTIFEIGSITKVFTGILLADAVQSGKATLDDPVSKHLPDDLLPEDSPLRTITLKELSTHTSGLPRLPPGLDREADPQDPYARYSVERLYESLKRISEKEIRNRGKTSYSNFGVGLLGHLLERISGKPYEDLLKEKILDPLGMQSTYLARPGLILPPDAAARFATAHSGGKAVSHWRIDALCGAGAMLSTAEDLARFAAAHFDPELPEPLRPALNLAATRQTNDIGLGWFIAKEGFLDHSGGTGGFRSELRISLPDKTATIRLMNSAGLSGEEKAIGDFTALEGYWMGALDTGKRKLRQVFRIAGDGRVVLHSIDQTGIGVAAARTVHDESGVRLTFAAIGGSFAGQVEGDTLEGTWEQNGRWPLVLTRQMSVPEGLIEALENRSTGAPGEFAGWWSGYLGGKSGLFVALEVEKIGNTADARFYSPDQTPVAFNIDRMTFEGSKLTFTIDSIKASYSGELDKTGVLSGVWKQGLLPLPLRLSHSEARPKREP